MSSVAVTENYVPLIDTNTVDLDRDPPVEHLATHALILRIADERSDRKTKALDFVGIAMEAINKHAGCAARHKYAANLERLIQPP